MIFLPVKNIYRLYNKLLKIKKPTQAFKISNKKVFICSIKYFLSKLHLLIYICDKNKYN